MRGRALRSTNLTSRGKFGVATTGIREFLNRFQRHGLIEKRPNAGWVFKGFTTSFALELFEIREMFELRSARAFAALPADVAALASAGEALREEHLRSSRDRWRYHDFSDLDSRFHRLVNTASPNRFIDGFFDLITLIFHYHYQWNKRDERQRNEVAIREHLAYIDALVGKNVGDGRTCLPRAPGLGTRDPAALDLAAIDIGTSAAPGGHSEGHDDDRALGNELDVDRHVQDVHAVIEDAKEEDAKHRSCDRSIAAHDAGAAENDGGDHVEFGPEGTIGGECGVNLRGLDDSRQCGPHAGDGVDQGLGQP